MQITNWYMVGLMATGIWVLGVCIGMYIATKIASSVTIKLTR